MKPENKDPNAVTEYIFMYSGAKVELDGGGCPTLEDIAVQCGRIPRFAGATKEWWSVLHHLLCAEEVATRHHSESPYIRLAALLHDAHEAPTGDIPSPFKPPAIREFQEELDKRLYTNLGVEWPDPESEVSKIVHNIDRALLGTEGELLGPPGDDWYLQVENEYSHTAKKVVECISAIYSDAYDTISPDGCAVKLFLTKAQALVKELND